MQDTILELCVDVFLLHIAHVETARAGAGEGFVPQIAALLILFVIAVAAHRLNGQVAVLKIGKSFSDVSPTSYLVAPEYLIK